MKKLKRVLAPRMDRSAPRRRSGKRRAAAATVAAATRADLHLLHVVPVFRGNNTEWTLGADEESPPELEPAVNAATSRGVIAVRDMAMGHPEHALLAVAEREGSDLVVVGHRGSRGCVAGSSAA